MHREANSEKVAKVVEVGSVEWLKLKVGKKTDEFRMPNLELDFSRSCRVSRIRRKRDVSECDCKNKNLNSELHREVNS